MNRTGGSHGWRGRPRGQANLAALAAALFALTTVTVIGVAAANGALAGEFRDVEDRHAATAVADGLVAPESPLTNRSNVLDRGALADLDARTLRSRYPVLDDRSFSVSVAGDVVAADGSVTGGATVRRIVLLESRSEETITPQFAGVNRVTLPLRTPRIDLDVSPPDNVSVSSVRANGRTVLRDPDGLDGSYAVSTSRRETLRLTFVANASLSTGDVAVTFYPSRTTKAELGVTVDA